MKKLVSFKIHGLVIFHGQNSSLGMMVSQVRCTVYNKFLGKPKLMDSKLDTLHMHTGHWKAFAPGLGVAISD